MRRFVLLPILLCFVAMTNVACACRTAPAPQPQAVFLAPAAPQVQAAPAAAPCAPGATFCPATSQAFVVVPSAPAPQVAAAPQQVLVYAAPAAQSACGQRYAYARPLSAPGSGGVNIGIGAMAEGLASIPVNFAVCTVDYVRCLFGLP